jgi:hypothetical protein
MMFFLSQRSGCRNRAEKIVGKDEQQWVINGC